ncbi:hypothetical protein AMS68_007166 [Peltaster fructicola]|uniref:CS domain-containing protein n=1 Tax=Peltaster fructicola TaxID=286661 RepID=A0A6H0Y477_9PEZI|nr:hypothetical protein AMS68_007166 [Peltaster fructicola]
MAAQKCVHRGCGKLFTDSNEECSFHSGTPVFHEGQKGYKCCKPRVLTFDEFLTIPPCTTGKHTTVDDTPAPLQVDATAEARSTEAKIKAAAPVDGNTALPPPVPRQAINAQPPQPSASPAPPEEESDNATAQPKDGVTCKRKGCDAVYKSGQDRSAEECVHHPGAPIFHEGSKGYSCCKRRVLEFDDFMRMPGCKTKTRHLFVGKPKPAGVEEAVKEVRSDFYQTPTTVIASLFLKKIDKEQSKVAFDQTSQSVELDLHTTDQKHYKNTVELFGAIDAERSSFRILGTKLELSIAKADGAGWPVLRRTDQHTGEIIQAGRAGRLER